MSKMSFLKQYILNPRDVGAVLPSTRYLANKMLEDIDFSKTKYIVEYGPGHGIFTGELIKKKHPDTVIVIIEKNYKFYEELQKKFGKINNVFLFHESAENIDACMTKVGMPYVDCIISGLPFASLPKHISTNILNKTKQVLKKEGKFITFQYTWFKKAFLNEYFMSMDVKMEFRNIPPAFVFTCSNCS